ncbi:3-hydroxyanthranilic acid dioxygenase, partial [Rozella allomycis CSF55]
LDWVSKNIDKFKGPVQNAIIQKGDFQIMIVLGPNSRKDYHINQTEEIFFQLKGDMLLKYVDLLNEFREVKIPEGNIYLLPKCVPHCPIRYAGSIGIVIEQTRDIDQIDTLRWYCQQCKYTVHEVQFNCEDLDVQIARVIEEFSKNTEIKQCKRCGFMNE